MVALAGCGTAQTSPDAARTAGVDGAVVDAFDAAPVDTFDAGADEPATVATVDLSRDLGPVNRDVFGADFEYIGAAVPAIEPVVAGIPLLRFPGGDDLSNFVWSAPDPASCADPQWTWDGFASMARSQGSALALETNLVRGTPLDAAAWLDDARSRGLRVAWVGVGNEAWGEWDAGFRPADAYANDVRATAAALRSVDPGVRVMLEIGTPGYDAWNRDAIRATADVIDALDYHFYPNRDSAPDPVRVAAGADAVPGVVARLRSLLRETAGARADSIAIVLGEYDGAHDAARYPPVPLGVSYAVWNMSDALFYGAAVGEMLRAGVAAAMFYELQGYRYGAVGGNACVPADYGALRPKLLALRLWLDHFGDRLLDATVTGSPMLEIGAAVSPDAPVGPVPALRVYASRTTDGSSVRLVVVNRSPDRDVPLRVDLPGFSPDSTARVWTLAGDSITATNENVGGAADAVRIETSTLATDPRGAIFRAPAHSVSALELPGAVSPRDPM